MIYDLLLPFASSLACEGFIFQAFPKTSALTDNGIIHKGIFRYTFSND